MASITFEQVELTYPGSTVAAVDPALALLFGVATGERQRP